MKRATTGRRLAVVGLAIVAVLVLVVAVVVQQEICPADEVAVTIDSIPTDTAWLCLVSETDGGPMPMNWYAHKIDAVVVHTDDCIVGTRRPEDSDRPFREWVQWIDGRRVGVLRRTTSKEWRVSWFMGLKTVVAGRRPLIGRGTWRCDVREADDTRPVSIEWVRSIGLPNRS